MGGRGEDLVLGDFGVGLLGVLTDLTDLTDFDLRFIREDLVVDLAGVAGSGISVTGADFSDFCFAIFTERLRGRLASATVLIDLSEKLDNGGVSSIRGDMTTAFSVLFRVNIPRNPPLESFL